MVIRTNELKIMVKCWLGLKSSSLPSDTPLFIFNKLGPSHAFGITKAGKSRYLISNLQIKGQASLQADTLLGL